MIRNFIYVVTDGILDDLARASIIGCSNIYAEHNPIITIFCLDSKVPEGDILFTMVNSKAKINVVTLTESDLRKIVPNLMDKTFSTVDKVDEEVSRSHWENAKAQNQHLAEFSDLAIFYMMKMQPDAAFLYMDSDILPIQPIQGGNDFIVSYDEGSDGNDYINSSFIYVPAGYKEVKERWISYLDNELVDSRHFRYGLPGPIAFDKFLGRTAKLSIQEQRDAMRDFTVISLPKTEFNVLTYKEVYEAAIVAITKDKPMTIVIEHKGPALNIPRSAITAALTHKSHTGIKLYLGLGHDAVGMQLMEFMFLPKEVRGISYYEDLRDKQE